MNYNEHYLTTAIVHGTKTGNEISDHFVDVNKTI
jgi:hypothetical protein